MDREAALPTSHLPPGTEIAQARDWDTSSVRLDSPAIEVMTDLTRVKAATTSAATTLREAEQTMIYQGVRMLFVVSEMPAVEGLITSNDLSGDRPMRIVQQRQCAHDDLCVADVMQPLTVLEAIEFDQLRTATVSNVIATLKRFGRNHLLVVDGTAARPPRRVRGVISRAQVERQLGAPVQVTEVATSFAELGQMLS